MTGAMKIAFYCPMKSPNHPVPSGDRLMARLLMQAMRLAGHEVEVVSELRSFMREPNGEEADALARDAEQERQRISALWKSHGTPDLWFCYHPITRRSIVWGHNSAAPMPSPM